MEQRYESFNKIWETIREAEKIAIFHHVNPDSDAYGSQFALAHVIADNFPQKTIFCYGEHVEGLNYLYESDAMFYKELPTELTDTIVITVDTANLARMDLGVLLQMPQVDIKIDHHPDLDHYAASEFVDINMPATCAILLDYFLLLEREDKDFVISETVYEKLYAGIVGDTGNFSYGNGLNQAFFTNVGVIFEKIDTKKILARFFEKTLNEVKFAGAFAQRIQQEEHFAYVEFDSAFVDASGVSLDYATSLVYMMSDITGVRVWASFCKDKTDQVIRCSLRSRYLDVSAIAQQFNGGGHKNAAGVRLKTWDEVAELKAALKTLSMQS